MKKYFSLVTIMSLVGCTSLAPPSPSEKMATQSAHQLVVPQTLMHDKKNYQLKAQQDLGNVARYMYFERRESIKNWKSAIELLLDRNPEQRSLSDRIALRERVYKNNGVEYFRLFEKDNALYSFVIYKPSAQYNSWQVNIAKGTDVAGCGFVQYQYSLKMPKNAKLMNLGKIKLIGYLKKYVVDKEMARLNKMDWQWKCKSMPINTAVLNNGK